MVALPWHPRWQLYLSATLVLMDTVPCASAGAEENLPILSLVGFPMEDIPHEGLGWGHPGGYDGHQGCAEAKMPTHTLPKHPPEGEGVTGSTAEGGDATWSMLGHEGPL